MNFQRSYNELKMKSYDIAIRVSDLEAGLGEDDSKILKLKKLFSKLQSSVNYAVYYKKHNMVKESILHLTYAYQVVEYIYSALERMEIPKKDVELDLGNKKQKFSIKNFKIRLSGKHALILLLIGVIYCFVVYWFFIR